MNSQKKKLFNHFFVIYVQYNITSCKGFYYHFIINLMMTYQTFSHNISISDSYLFSPIVLLNIFLIRFNLEKALSVKELDISKVKHIYHDQ
jgi:hypothetical protein